MASMKILRLPDVLRKTGLSRSTIYDMISSGEFPRQVKIGRRAVGWISDEVDLWIHQRIRLHAEKSCRSQVV